MFIVSVNQDVDGISKLLDDTIRILKDSVILLEFNAKRLRISEGIVKNLHPDGRSYLAAHMLMT